MNHLKIEKTLSSPEIDFNPKSGILKINGESYPQNSALFYKPLVDWIQEYLNTTSNLVLDAKIDYMNSSSFSYIHKILDILEDSHKNGKSILVKWQYNSTDEQQKESAEDIFSQFTFSFVLSPKE